MFRPKFSQDFRESDMVDICQCNLVTTIYVFCQFPVFHSVLIILRTQQIDGRISADIQHPRIQPSFRRIIRINFPPDIDEDILQHIVGYFGGMDNLEDNSVQGPAVMIVQVGKCLPIPCP